MLAETFEPWQPWLMAMAFVGIGLLLAGFFARTPASHLFRASGWILFGAYWPFQAPTFFTGPEADPINGYFTLLGPVFLGWIAWHEWTSWKWREDPPALRWFAGASAIAAATYFLVYQVPPVTAFILHHTAVQSSWMLDWMFGIPSVVVDDADGISHIYLNGGAEYAVTIVLACAAIQSIMIFVGAIACLDIEARRKWRAIGWIVPTIYVLNLFRIAGIVYGFKIQGLSWFGLDSFETMHNLGKVGSLVAMIFIALVVFRSMPELHGHILDLFDLRRRRRMTVSSGSGETLT